MKINCSRMLMFTSFVLGSCLSIPVYAAKVDAFLQADPDQDADGVSNYDDYCPRTPAGMLVWKKRDAEAGKVQARWVGCGGPGDPYDPNYQPPVRRDDSLLERVLALYDQGEMPSLADFNPEIALLGKSIDASKPNFLNSNQLVSLHVGDDVTGVFTYSGSYKRELEGEPYTREQAQAELLGKVQENQALPLVLHPERSMIASILSAPGHYEMCLFFRKTSLSDGRVILVVKFYSGGSLGISHNLELCGNKITSAGYYFLPQKL